MLRADFSNDGRVMSRFTGDAKHAMPPAAFSGVRRASNASDGLPLEMMRAALPPMMRAGTPPARGRCAEADVRAGVVST